MRFLASLILVSSLAFMGCAGDASSLMSVWNDGSVGGPAGSGGTGGSPGAGGQVIYPTGGTGGGITIPEGGAGGYSTGSIYVPGGIRDLATAQCVVTSGGTCPVSSDYLACIQGNCGMNLTACYYSDGISRAAGGACQSYANCLLSCSCDAGRSVCEGDCAQKFAYYDPECSTCYFNLVACTSKFNCQMTNLCVAGAGGAVAGGGGVVYPTAILDAGPAPMPRSP